MFEAIPNGQKDEKRFMNFHQQVFELAVKIIFEVS